MKRLGRSLCLPETTQGHRAEWNDEDDLRRAPGSVVERVVVGPRHHARAGRAERERARDDGPPRAGAGDDDAARDAARGDRGLSGDAAGPVAARGPAGRRAQPVEPRLRQPGDRLGDGPRPARLLRAAGASRAPADDPHGFAARRAPGSLVGRPGRRADRIHPGHGGGRPDRRRRPRRGLVGAGPALGEPGALRQEPVCRRHRRRRPADPGRRRAPEGVRAAGHDPRRDAPLRHQLLPGARYLRRPGAGQPQ